MESCRKGSKSPLVFLLQLLAALVLRPGTEYSTLKPASRALRRSRHGGEQQLQQLLQQQFNLLLEQQQWMLLQQPLLLHFRAVRRLHFSRELPLAAKLAYASCACFLPP